MEMHAVGINLHGMIILRYKKLFNEMPELLQLRLPVNTLQFTQYAFPEYQICPTRDNELLVIHQITKSVAFDLLLPKIRI